MIEDHLKRAQGRMLDGDYSAALELLLSAYNLNPNHPTLCRMLCDAYSALDNSAKAIHFGYRAVELMPQSASACSALALACSESDPDEALDMASRALQLEPGNSQAFYAAGKAWFYKKDYSQAVQNFEQALLYKPGDPRVIRDTARAYDLSGDYLNATHYAEQYLALEGMELSMHLLCADGNRILGNFGRALQLLDTLLALNPDSGPAFHSKTQTLLRMKRLDLARDFVDEFRKGLLENTPWLESALGDLYVEHWELPSAIRHYEKALGLDPEFQISRWWLLQGLDLEKEDRLEPAVKAYRRAVKIQPDLLAGWNALSAVFAKQDFWVDAIECGHHAVDLAPDDPGNYHNMVQFYERALSSGLLAGDGPKHQLEVFRRKIQELTGRFGDQWKKNVW